MDENLVANLLLEPGRSVEGLPQTDEYLIRIAKASAKEKPFYVVRDWMLFDVLVSDTTEALLKSAQMRPTLLYAQKIMYDSRCSGARAGAIRSGFELQMREGWFETKQTVFILAGPGFRKHASVPALQALDRL